MKEKKYYKIGEISKLFNIGLDSIRYYEEIGVLAPYRNPENNYRLYCTDDIRKILTIRELLNLGFSMDEIKCYETSRTLSNTQQLLQDELTIINSKLIDLLQQKKNLQSRLITIENAIHNCNRTTVSLLQLDARPCIMISDSNIPDAYVDFSLLEYMKLNPQHVDTIGSCGCYTLNIEKSNPDSLYFHTENVFFFSENSFYESNYTLAAGMYLSIFYKGNHSQTKLLMPKLFDYATSHNLVPNGSPIEFCYIDSYETFLESEFITELQLPVISKSI